MPCRRNIIVVSVPTARAVTAGPLIRHNDVHTDDLKPRRSRRAGQ